MRIKSKESYNSGGNCMLIELLVEGGGALASITLTEEHIVGRKIPYKDDDGEKNYEFHEVVLWTATDTQSLKYIPEEIKSEVLKVYQDYRKKYNRDQDITVL